MSESQRIDRLEERVTALEKSSASNAAATLGKLSRANPTEAQRQASRENGKKRTKKTPPPKR